MAQTNINMTESEEMRVSEETADSERRRVARTNIELRAWNQVRPSDYQTTDTERRRVAQTDIEMRGIEHFYDTETRLYISNITLPSLVEGERLYINRIILPTLVAALTEGRNFKGHLIHTMLAFKHNMYGANLMHTDLTDLIPSNHVLGQLCVVAMVEIQEERDPFEQ
jgi:hypothetical protein